MVSEKRLISVDEWDTFFAEHIYNRCFRNEYEQGYTDALDRVDDWMDAHPTVDAVEVVRCENCQYWNPRYETMGMCMKHNSIVTFTKPDFYCALGKEKNDGICKED